jgi:hypothetical protein
MTTQFVEGAIVVTPLFVGFAVHGLFIRFRIGTQFARPISSSLFGANKTWRGAGSVALGTALGFIVIRPPLLPYRDPTHFALIGFLVGAAAMAAELPNSFLKRRLGIAPGAQASGMRGLVFHVVDQIDVVLGAWALLACVATPTWPRIGGSILAMYVGHQLISIVGFQLGMRRTAR